jgi:hypothetical protein
MMLPVRLQNNAGFVTFKMNDKMDTYHNQLQKELITTSTNSKFQRIDVS